MGVATIEFSPPPTPGAIHSKRTTRQAQLPDLILKGGNNNHLGWVNNPDGPTSRLQAVGLQRWRWESTQDPLNRLLGGYFKTCSDANPLWRLDLGEVETEEENLFHVHEGTPLGMLNTEARWENHLFQNDNGWFVSSLTFLKT